MKIYIVRSFPDEHKMWGEDKICGYYTNTVDLAVAVNKHREELGIPAKINAYRLIFTEDFRTLADYMYTGLIEIVDSDVWND